MNIVIGGSYHKFLNEINAQHRKLEENGHHVIAPIKDAKQSKVDSWYNYVLFQGEEMENPVEVQKRFMQKIYKADAFVLCNKGGYIGMTAAMELGWAYGEVSNKFQRIKQIYLTDPITLLDTMKKQQGRLSLKDVEEDPQYSFFKKFYKVEEPPEDYARFVCIDIYGYEDDGALTIGIDTLLTKENNRDLDDGR